MKAARWIPLAAALALAACAANDRGGGIEASGRVEATEVRVASKLPGRILDVAVEEGDPVRRGAAIARFEPETSEARVDRARASARAARADVERIRSDAAVLRHHVRTARQDLERAWALHEAGAAPERRIEEAEDALTELEGRLASSEAAERAARAAAGGADAALEEALDALAETEVVAPLDGVVLLRLVEPGEVVAAGRPLVVLHDPADLRLRVYVPEDRIGEVQIGDPVDVTVDAFPNRVFDGTVTRVAQEAEFTPRDVHMPDERTSLVFGVDVRVRDPERYLKPGMPADAVIEVTGTAMAADRSDE